MEHGLDIYQDDVDITDCTLSGSTKGLSVYSSGYVKVQRCNFTRNNNAVKWSKTSARLLFLDSEFRTNANGLVGAYTEDVIVSGCRFTGTSNTALKINDWRREGTRSVVVENNLFEMNYLSLYCEGGYPNITRIRGNTFRNDTHGTAVQLIMYETYMIVENNTFVDLRRGALSVTFNRRSIKQAIIRNNTYRRIKEIPIQVWNANYGNLTVERNTFLNHLPSDTTAGIYVTFNYGISGRIRMNEFSKNIGKNIVEIHLQGSIPEHAEPLDIAANVFFDNIVSQAILVTKTDMCTVTGNMFSNVLSPYDLLVSFESNNLSALYNWWGDAGEDHVTERIWDKSDDPKLGRVLYEPFLLKNEMPCDEVANCSGHGRCVRPNTCDCQSGWTGADCGRFSCVHVGGCRGRGVCVGPNVCDCEDGWLAPDCVQASCYERNNCSGGHGICVGPNRCVTRLVGTTTNLLSIIFYFLKCTSIIVVP